MNKMKALTNIGPQHSFYNKLDLSGYNQAIVLDDKGCIFAQFYGFHAKINANKYVETFGV